MYGLPSDFDASVFVGRELEAVCFTANSVQLSFDNDVSITLQSTFRFKSSPDEDEATMSVPVTHSNLMTIAGRKVDHATGTRDGTLTLVFDGGLTLVCVDDSREYESYQIRIGEREVVV